MSAVACYGEGLIDFTQEGGTFVPHPGGSPYNVAIALGRLECSVEFCSQLSTDMFGKQLYDYLHKNHVGVDNIIRSDSPSTLAFVSTPENAEPEYAFYSIGAADVILDNTSSFSQSTARLHHFGSISLMQEPCGTFWEKYIHNLDGFISFDPNIRPALIPCRDDYLARFERITSGIQLLRLSLADMQWLAPNESVESFCTHMISRGIQVVAITSGSDGAWVYTRDHVLHQPAMSIDVVDTIGAGDTFTAGFLSVIVDYIDDRYQLNANEVILSEALKMGCIAAALNCREKGANPPTKEQIIAAI
ncbi:carbohydrate kinase family protein [Klebsiella sp. R445]